MKPRVFVFGLPPRSQGQFSVNLYVSNGSNSHGDEVFKADNDETGLISGIANTEIQIGNSITFVIMSTGTVYYSRKLEYLGGDISHVPFFEKERDISSDWISKGWDIEALQHWNPTASNEKGKQNEHNFLVAKKIAKDPIYVSYFYESEIDYLEKFHKLWIGLNAYASQKSGDLGDRMKVLALVESPLKQKFWSIVDSVRDIEAATQFGKIIPLSGLEDVGAAIVRDEISRSCSVFDFLQTAKFASISYMESSKELDGLVFLNTRSDNHEYWNTYRRYNQFLATEEGIVAAANLENAFRSPLAPTSLKRYGKLLFHVPFHDNKSGSLFSLADYFGKAYQESPYTGQTDNSGKPNIAKQKFEKVDPLFFRYLSLLYEFRCAYFHGSLASNEQNNDLARTAYTSLRELYVAILE